MAQIVTSLARGSLPPTLVKTVITSLDMFNTRVSGAPVNKDTHEETNTAKKKA